MVEALLACQAVYLSISIGSTLPKVADKVDVKLLLAMGCFYASYRIKLSG